MKKKKIIYITALIVLLVLTFFCYRRFVVFYYDHYYYIEHSWNVDRINTVDKPLINIEKTVTLTNKKVNNDEYLTYKNVKIRNDFSNFEKTDVSADMAIYSFKDEKDQNREMLFWISPFKKTFVDYIKYEEDNFDSKEISKEKVIAFLEKNNITNDIELIKLLEENKNMKNNIFTSVSKMKENLLINYLQIEFLGSYTENRDVILINGDYTGYILEDTNNTKTAYLIKDNKRYAFLFLGKDYFTDEYIYELLSTVVIE